MTAISFRTTVLAVFMAIGLSAGTALADGVDAAKGFIQTLGDKAVSTIAATQQDEEARLRQFRSLLNDNFDVPGIGRFVLGRYWRVATPEQRDEYLKLFEESIIRTYARRFSDYSGETIAVEKARKDGEDFILVDSVIQRPTGGPVAVTWRLLGQGKDFKIVDVVVEGVSMSVTQRSDFASVIQSGGGNIEALLKVMRERLGKA
ncbi:MULTISPECIES: phospholipid-binding protein MlaC [Oceanibaculum]|uniref:Toluene tolerance transporter putative n=1 Tax=Oceanibaculum indicum P24 TaxID=1207063 RepID=K2JQ09_9PROT|nr:MULTISPECIES: ABC transporter substrate-binding protein [Oceanibaculum]EKE77353.1 toluene tolerance transporter putative [Oceanibaculum indicum P24]MCH2395330.1 ABC transporter substrate-binding protein [Oceanibaculum sp.]